MCAAPGCCTGVRLGGCLLLPCSCRLELQVAPLPCAQWYNASAQRCRAGSQIHIRCSGTSSRRMYSCCACVLYGKSYAIGLYFEFPSCPMVGALVSRVGAKPRAEQFSLFYKHARVGHVHVGIARFSLTIAQQTNSIRPLQRHQLGSACFSSNHLYIYCPRQHAAGNCCA